MTALPPAGASFEVPDGVARLVREHLVCPQDIADRVCVSKQAVSQWVRRYPEFAALIVASPGGPLWWWPQAKALLDELGLPRKVSTEAQKRRRRGEPS